MEEFVMVMRMAIGRERDLTREERTVYRCDPP
jgi:hypothetical protein